MNIDGLKNNATRPTLPGHDTRVKTRKHVAANATANGEAYSPMPIPVQNHSTTNAISARRHVKKRPTSTIRHNRAAVYVANSESPV